MVTDGETQTASHVVGRERPSRVWTLTLATGPSVGVQRVLRVGDTVVLGRGSDAFGEDAVLADTRLSRQHLTVVVGPAGELTARDMGSRNGSFLNAERFEQASIRETEILGLGRTLVLVEPGEPSPTDIGEPGPASSVAYSVALAGVRRGRDRGTPLVLSGPTGAGKGELVEWIAGGRPRAHWRPGRDAPTDAHACLAVEQLEDHPSGTAEYLERWLREANPAQLVVTTALSLDAFLSGSPIQHALASRLGSGFVSVPPLRERRADIPGLAAAMVREHDPEASLDPELVFRLLAYEWPGNLHQLQGVLEHCTAAAQGNSLIALPPDLDALLDVRPSKATHDAPRTQALTVAEHGMRFAWGEVVSPDFALTSPVARVLWALCRRRAAGSLDAIDPDLLVREVWPEETLVRRSGRNRLYVALSSLRKAGLADILERGPSGYRLSPRVEVVVAEPAVDREAVSD